MLFWYELRCELLWFVYGNNLSYFSVYFSVFSFEISGLMSPHVSMLLEFMEISAEVLTV